MRHLFVPVAAACLAMSASTAASAQSPADQTAKFAEAHAIIAVMFPAAERQRMTDKMLADIIAPMRRNMPPVLMADAGLKKIVDDFIAESLAQQRPILLKHMPDMLDAMATAYTHEFSLAELKNIHAFAESPAGTHYLSKSTAMIGDPAVQKVNQEMFAEAQKASAPMLAEFKQKVVAYVTAHPEIASKLQAAAK